MYISRNNKGFTLLEIIIVIVIVGVLVTLTTVIYSGVQSSAKDVSVLSDIDKMDALQTNYGLKNNVAGKAYYSGNGPDAELGFTPTDGNVISVVIDSSDYCIRGYSAKGTKTNMENAFFKESSPGVCALLVTVDPSTPGFDSYPVATSISGYWSLAPDGYLLEDGSAVSRTTYADLFAVIGTTYGPGDGSTTFNLPDSRGRVTVNKNTSDTEFASLGQKYGEKTHLLLASESGLKGHNHVQNAHTHTQIIANSNGYGGSDGQFAGSGYAGATHAYTYSATGYTTATNQAVAASDASSAHNNIQPSIAKTFAIKHRVPSDTTSKLPAGTSISGYWTSAPTGYLTEDGAEVSRTTYASLFSAIGVTFGSGNGSTTFNLPDSRGRVAVNKNPNDSEFNEVGEVSGEKTHLLTGQEMGERGHNHTQNSHSHQQIVMNSNGYGGSDGQAAGSGYAASTHGSWQTTSVTATNQAVSDANASSLHNNIQPSIVKLVVIKYTPIDGSVDGIAKGTTVQGYWSTPPAGYLFEDGSAISRVAYADLFAAIGTTYGSGNGSTTFNLPDSRGRVAVNVNASDAEFNEVGELSGAKVHLLSSAESGEKGHNHLQDTHRHLETVSDSNGYGGSDGQAAGSGHAASTHGSWQTALTTATNQAVSSSSASSAHNNIQPSIVQNFAIRY